MSTITAETLFTQEMHHTLEHISTMLKSYFRTLNDPNLKTLLLISLGMCLNANNVYQMLQTVGLPKTTTYNRIKNVSVSSWQQLLQSHLYDIAIPVLRNRLKTSESTKSRDRFILAVDDTVIAHIATELSYVWR